MKRIALDTDAVNRILDTPGLLEAIKDAAGRGCFILIGNHVVRDQLVATPDHARRARLLEIYDALPRKDVLTKGGIFNISRYGAARYGDGSDTGISLSEARTAGRGGGHDALIATTAAGEADVLVTNDKELTAKVKVSAAQIEVWTFEGFIQFVRSS